jgi:hypothetical protein
MDHLLPRIGSKNEVPNKLFLAKTAFFKFCFVTEFGDKKSKTLSDLAEFEKVFAKSL